MMRWCRSFIVFVVPVVTLFTVTTAAAAAVCPASAFAAGHVVATSTCPPLPDSGMDLVQHPQIGGDSIVYRVSGHADNPFYAILHWTIGTPTADTWPSFPWGETAQPNSSGFIGIRSTGDYDNGVAVYEGTADEHATVRATNGVLDVLIAGGPYNCGNPRISGNRVVWQQDS
ncbi:MAG TPA: hypothetical protein VK576_08775, partial [Thermoleophilia bacterium]|nr:hypothetical protein [Thermoleophilia bacterium]